MSGNPVFLFELLIFSGAALAWGAWELWSVRRSRDTDTSQPAEPEPGASSGEPRHPEG
jgi:hypothetical protein